MIFNSRALLLLYLNTRSFSNKMNVHIDLTKEIEELNAGYSCFLCKKLLSDPVVLKPCQDVFCAKCVRPEFTNCPECKIPFLETDIKSDDLSTSVIRSLKEFEKIFRVPAENVVLDDDPFFKEILSHVVFVPETRRNPKGESPLHVACRKGNIAAVKNLIAKGADLNFLDYAGWTPLHEAVQKCREECVELLLDEGASPDVPGEGYNTPLHKASELGHYNIVRILLKYGAQMDRVNYIGLTPMACASSEDIKNLFILQHTEKMIFQKYFINKTVNVYYSNLAKENIDCIQKILRLKVVSPLDFIQKDDCTHLIISDEINDGLSLNCLFGILKGIFVVQEAWVSAYASTKNESLAFKYFPNKYKKAYRESFLNNLKRQPRLFDGINFYFVGHTKPFKIHDIELTKKDLVDLVQVGGGKVLHREPALRTVEGQLYYPYHADSKLEFSTCANFIIYFEGDPPKLLYNMKELRHKTSKWLIDCILNFSILA